MLRILLAKGLSSLCVSQSLEGTASWKGAHLIPLSAHMTTNVPQQSQDQNVYRTLFYADIAMFASSNGQYKPDILSATIT